MAHGDYFCCAICDCKLDYSESPGTKDRICEECLKQLRDFGLNIATVDELIEYIEKSDIDKVTEKLKKLGFTKCYYLNNVDAVVMKRGIQFDENRNIKEGM